MHESKMRNIATAFCTAAMVVVAGCSGGGGSGGGTSAVSPVASAVLSGTVSGTVIKVVNATTGAVLAQTDTAPLSNPPFPFTLSNLPIHVPLKVFFFSGGGAFPLYVGSPTTNVFTILTSGTIDLGFVTMAGGIATPGTQPSSGTISLGTADPSMPPGAAPPPATLTVSTPPPGSAIIVNFSVINFTIGGVGQQHLHVRVDGGTTHHFYNGSSNQVTGGTIVQWQSPTSFRLNGLSVGDHQVTVKLATASDGEFVNPEANPPVVTVTITPPPSNPATLAVTSPSPGASLPSGPITVSFSVEHFTIGGQGQDHLHIYLDGGATASHFYNGSTNQVLDDMGSPVSNMTRLGNSSFEVMGLANGAHSIRLGLANAAHQELQNSEANPPTLNFTIQTPQGMATVSVTSGTSFLSSPVRIAFEVTNFTIGLQGTPHLRFTIDNGPAHDFYNGSGINNDNGVLLNGVHTHVVHWTSTGSFDLFGLGAGPHQVRLALVDGSNNELSNSEAKTTHQFTVQQPPTGDLSLELMLDGLNFPTGLDQAPDGRIFFNDRFNGYVRVIHQGWSLDPAFFCYLEGPAGGEQGLLSLALDPNFSSNHSLYVFYTATGPVNRVSRVTNSGTGCTETVILDNLPTGNVHNGGILTFGPDGKLFVTIGDVDDPNSAQDLDSLAGKILRVNPDGSAPPDNPFYVNGLGNRDKVYSRGHRNSFGLTVHPSTGHLWESENGPTNNDEVNHIEPGGNYGWPIGSGALNQSGLIDPIVVFGMPIAPTEIVGIPSDSSIYPQAYRGNLLMAAWNDGTIRLIIPDPGNPGHPGTTSVAYSGGVGGLVSLMLGSDGYVYVTKGGTGNSDGAIYRVVPH